MAIVLATQGFGVLPVGGPDKSLVRMGSSEGEGEAVELSEPIPVSLNDQAAEAFMGEELGEAVQFSVEGRVVSKSVAEDYPFEGESREKRRVSVHITRIHKRRPQTLSEVTRMMRDRWDSDVSPG
jgi:hypothetical protein